MNDMRKLMDAIADDQPDYKPLNSVKIGGVSKITADIYDQTVVLKDPRGNEIEIFYDELNDVLVYLRQAGIQGFERNNDYE